RTLQELVRQRYAFLLQGQEGFLWYDDFRHDPRKRRLSSDGLRPARTRHSVFFRRQNPKPNQPTIGKLIPGLSLGLFRVSRFSCASCLRKDSKNSALQPTAPLVRGGESRIRVREMQSTFHLCAQRNAFRRRAVCINNPIVRPSSPTAAYTANLGLC